MTFLFTIQSILEVIAVSFIIWGLFNEQKLVRFEKNIMAKIRRKNINAPRNNTNYSKHCA